MGRRRARRAHFVLALRTLRISRANRPRRPRGPPQPRSRMKSWGTWKSRFSARKLKQIGDPAGTYTMKVTREGQAQLFFPGSPTADCYAGEAECIELEMKANGAEADNRGVAGLHRIGAVQLHVDPRPAHDEEGQGRLHAVSSGVFRPRDLATPVLSPARSIGHRPTEPACRHAQPLFATSIPKCRYAARLPQPPERGLRAHGRRVGPARLERSPDDDSCPSEALSRP